MTLWWDAAWGVVRRDAIIYFSYRTQLVSQLFGVMFSVVLFHYIARLLHTTTINYFAFVVIGLVIVQALVTTLGAIPGALRQEMVAGTLERFLVSRFGAPAGILAMIAFPTLLSFATGILMLVFAVVVFGMHLAGTAPLAIPVALLGVLAFVPVTLLLAAPVIVVKQATFAVQFVLAGIAIIGGLYFPVSLLPAWIRWAADVQPFTPATDALRHLLVGSPAQHSMALDLGKLAGFAIVLFPLAMWALRRTVVYAQRRGTVIEY